ncbi:Hypothetical protein PBC10988_12660 [Planctomycetales bacterium 10988]|nr:Hypothetical protein PBC10988_12660 [Planctomycetales bacterium 10988]
MRLLILGDSVTVGCGFSGVTAETRYVELLRQNFQLTNTNVELVDSALEGIDTGYAKKRFNRMVAAFEPDTVLVLLGLNDAEPPGERPPATPSDYEQNLMGLVDRILGIDARPLLAAPNPRFPLPSATSEATDSLLTATNLMPPYVESLAKVADHFQIGWMNVHQQFLEQGRLADLLPDGIHPNAAGHQIIAETLSTFLVPFFGGNPSALPHFQSADVTGLSES